MSSSRVGRGALSEEHELVVRTGERLKKMEKEKMEEVSKAMEEMRRPFTSFQPGDRRVFPFYFMLAMAKFPNTKRSADFISIMKECNIFKGEPNEKNNSNLRRSNSRDGDLSRLGSWLSPDRRGRTFPYRQLEEPIRGTITLCRGQIASSDPHHSLNRPSPALSPLFANCDGHHCDWRSNGGEGRHWGPMRELNPQLGQVNTQFPTEELKRSENAWTRHKRAEDETTAKVKHVRSLLNKLTVEKFDQIFAQIVEVEIDNAETLKGIVKEIFEKPLCQPKFASMYAELCRRLDQATQQVLAEKKLSFKRILLDSCKEEFARFYYDKKEGELVTESETIDQDKYAETSKAKTKKKERDSIEKEEEGMNELKKKQRMLANVRFIGELYLKDMIREQIIHKSCIAKLLNLASQSLEEDVLEAACKLISKTGAKLSSSSITIDHIKHYFEILKTLSNDKRVAARIRFMIQDLIEQRANKWKVRREEVAAKKIAEIHKDIEEKEKARQEAAIAMRERKHRTHGSRVNHGRGMGSKPRLSMTMASASKAPCSGQSRTNIILERGLNSSSTNLPVSSNISMRLGPKSTFGGSSGPWLRPRTFFKTDSGNLSTESSDSSMKGSRCSAVNINSERPIFGICASDNNRLKSTATNTIIHHQPISKTEHLAPPVQLMENSSVKRKAKSIYEEYLSIENIDEFTICMVEEVKKLDYQSFIENVVKIFLEGKKDKVQKTQKLFTALLENDSVPATIFVDSLKKYGTELRNLEVDYPLVVELYAEIAVALASTKEFKVIENNGDFGLGFLRKILDNSSEKNVVAKLVISICSAFYQREKCSKRDSSAKKLTGKVYKSLNFDLSAEMTAWDDKIGPEMLRRMLERAKMSFLIPSHEN